MIDRFHLLRGTVERHVDFPAQQIAVRHVDVWLPPEYAADPTRRYPVIYMHDGQNLFTPGYAYGGIDWGIDPALCQLIESGATAGAIVVGVWNTGKRWAEYMPARPLRDPQAHAALDLFIATTGESPVSDGYLRFLVEELKPTIDATYRTLPDRDNTLVMGSSMGGLISLYALSEYPEIFGGAACLSTHWSIGGDMLVDAMAAHVPPSGQHRLYFDFGTLGLDADYEPFQRRMDEHLRALGYREGMDWATHKFAGADHNEAAWRERVHLPLRFLLRI